jgi:4-hydroxy-tetrahydrodipicolinate reductase
MTRLAIIGAGGRMGRALLRGTLSDSSLQLAAAVVSASSPLQGQDAGELIGLPAAGIALGVDLRAAIAAADVAVDFSSAAATATHLAACVAAGKALLIGTTGFATGLEAKFREAAARIPLMVAPNTSLGITLLLELVRTAAELLPPDFDVEIVEAHHRNKRDAPSGTALALGAAAAAGRAQELAAVRTSHTDSGQPRRQGQIGFAAIRAGDLAGEHTVLFAGAGEQLSLRHVATDRAVFAHGALKAAVWLARRSPGRYSMRDFVRAKSAG